MRKIIKVIEKGSKKVKVEEEQEGEEDNNDWREEQSQTEREEREANEKQLKLNETMTESESFGSNDEKKNTNEEKRSRAITTTSSDTKCAICLSIISNRSLTDTCLHEYCFQCISQWSQNHNRCPSCRQVYSNILFNIVSEEVFEQMAVNEPVVEDLDDMLYRIYQCVQSMAIRRQTIRNLERDSVTNQNQIIQETGEFDRQLERLERDIQVWEPIEREDNRTEIIIMNAMNRNNILENIEVPNNVSIESFPSLESLSGTPVYDSEDSENSSEESIKVGMDRVLYSAYELLAFMAIVRKAILISRQERVVQLLQIFNAKLIEMQIKNPTQMREDIRELEIELERLEGLNNRADQIARGALAQEIDGNDSQDSENSWEDEERDE